MFVTFENRNHSCAHNHMDLYLHVFDFRYTNRNALGVEDSERAERLLQSVKGKRLIFKRLLSECAWRKRNAK